MSRIFHVRINLDAVSADLNTLVDDAERGAWLRGFMSGAAGGANRFVDTSPAYLGWHNGASARGHAEQFHEKQAEHGAKSAKVRKEKYGSSQPSKVVRTTIEGGSNDPRTTPEGTPNLSNNRIIEEENKRIIEETNTADAPVAKAPKVKTEADILIDQHPFKISGPKRGHRPVVNEIIKLIGVEEAGNLLSSIEEPLWPDRLMAAANRWHKVPEPSARPRWNPSAELRAEYDAFNLTSNESHGS